jgi:riboflavin synthase
MFTGIIEAFGTVTSISQKGNGKAITFQAPTQMISQLKTGDSISVSGACSTALDITNTTFTVDYLPESLSKTTLNDLRVDSVVNLELCLTPQSRIGGHFVTGHVDTVGCITQLTQEVPWGSIEITFDTKWSKYIVDKGSITIDGISLTIVHRSLTTLTCHLIPHTFTHTILGQKQIGHRVNLEFDILGKYVLNQPR